ncbi:hypothetical protein NL676_014899 [Syzygium grande]|nr:hypothetical protein NL676_014899 [Syzygium grande]
MEDLRDHGEKDGGRGGVQGVEDLRMEKEARRAHLREQVIGEESLREWSAMKELISENRSSACWRQLAREIIVGQVKVSKPRQSTYMKGDFADQSGVREFNRKASHDTPARCNDESPYSSKEIQQANQAIVDELKQISEREVEMEDLRDHGEKDGGRGGVQGVEDLRMEKEARRAHLREQVIGEESLREWSAMKELISENKSSACW